VFKSVGDTMTLSLSKLSTLGVVIRRCRNWLPVALSRMGIAQMTRTVQLRNGLVLHSRGLHADYYWGNVFEAAVADVYGIEASEADVIVDVGANVGAFACLAAWTHPRAKVLAFEPQDEYATLLETNLEANALNNVRIVRSPVTADGREVSFHFQGGGGSSGLYDLGADRRVTMKSIALNTDDLAGESLFMKLDCEGAEGEIVRWVAEHSRDLPAKVRIVCEWHPWCPMRPPEAIALLNQCGFQAALSERYREPYLTAWR